MALNAALTIQDGFAAAASPALGTYQNVTPGNTMTVGLQSQGTATSWTARILPSGDQNSIGVNDPLANQVFSSSTVFTWPVVMPFRPCSFIVASEVTDGQNVLTGVTYVKNYVGGSNGYVKRARVVTVAALAAYTAGGGVLNANSNGALTVDGVTVALGDRVLLTMGAAGADNGLYVVSAAGGASAKYQLTRAPEWATGSVLEPQQIVEVGAEGTAFSYPSKWKVTTTGLVTVDTTSIAMYPAVMRGNVALSGGAATVTNLFVLATSSGMGLVDTTAANAVKGVLTAGVPGTGQLVLAGTTTDSINWAIINFS